MYIVSQNRYNVLLCLPVWHTATTSRHWSQTTIAFRIVNVYSCSTHSALYRRRQSISYGIRSSVEQSSIACRRWFISLSTFRSRLKSHLFSISYLNFRLFHLWVVSAVTCHFGHYNRFYAYNFTGGLSIRKFATVQLLKINVNSLKLGVRTTWWSRTTKTAKIF